MIENNADYSAEPGLDEYQILGRVYMRFDKIKNYKNNRFLGETNGKAYYLEIDESNKNATVYIMRRNESY